MAGASEGLNRNRRPTFVGGRHRRGFPRSCGQTPTSRVSAKLWTGTDQPRIGPPIPAIAGPHEFQDGHRPVGWGQAPTSGRRLWTGTDQPRRSPVREVVDRHRPRAVQRRSRTGAKRPCPSPSPGQAPGGGRASPFRSAFGGPSRPFETARGAGYWTSFDRKNRSQVPTAPPRPPSTPPRALIRIPPSPSGLWTGREYGRIPGIPEDGVSGSFLVDTFEARSPITARRRCLRHPPT